MRPHGSAEELEARRLRAAALFEQGWSNAEIARRVEADRSSVGRWRQQYDRGESLRAKPMRGRPSKLSAKQKQGLQKRLMKGASREGFASDLWTVPRIQQLIRERYGVEYHVGHLNKLLHSLGFSPSEARKTGSRTR